MYQGGVISIELDLAEPQASLLMTLCWNLLSFNWVAHSWKPQAYSPEIPGQLALEIELAL